MYRPAAFRSRRRAARYFAITGGFFLRNTRVTKARPRLKVMRRGTRPILITSPSNPVDALRALT